MITSMKRVIIICEGPTEQEFCSDVLTPYFAKTDIYIYFPLINKSGGGIVPWETLKKQIEIHLKQDSSATVTTLIDYYGIPEEFRIYSFSRNPLFTFLYQSTFFQFSQ